MASSSSPPSSEASELLYDSIHMGRSSIDLYSNDVGAPFTQISSFAAYVGGSPTNISVGGRRLGLKTALVTGIGQDPVGDFIVSFLQKEGVDLKYSPRVPQRTSAVVLGIEPPDKFPLVYYRENCADINLTIDHVLDVPFSQARVFQFAGTNLSREPSRSATLTAIEFAKQAGLTVVFDVDFRPDQWHDIRAFGVTCRSVLSSIDIVVGTEDELNAALLRPSSTATSQVALSECVSDIHVQGDVFSAVRQIIRLGPSVVVEKRGRDGARLHFKSSFLPSPDNLTEETRRVWYKVPLEVSQSASSDLHIVSVDVPGYPVVVANILGAGDAFAAGFLYGFLRGWGFYRACRLGNACGAIVVTKHGCANFMPTLEEVEEFVRERGAFD